MIHSRYLAAKVKSERTANSEKNLTEMKLLEKSHILIHQQEKQNKKQSNKIQKIDRNETARKSHILIPFKWNVFLKRKKSQRAISGEYVFVIKEVTVASKRLLFILFGS